MREHTHSVYIERPVEDVFAFMDNVALEPEWQPSLTSASSEPAGPTTVGTKKLYTSVVLGKKVKNTYVTTVFEKNKRIVYETTPDSTLSGAALFTWESMGLGTLVTISVRGEPKGALRLVPKKMLDRYSETEMEASLQRLKAILELNH